MNFEEALRQIVFGGEIEDKLLDLDQFDIDTNFEPIDSLITPGRVGSLQFSPEQIKFPRAGSFHLPDKRALAIHFFANHELLAIEMMASALLMFPGEDRSFVRGLLSTIKDEQKHFKLYQSRMKNLGVAFGDYPLNDFFWRQFREIKTPQEFYALVALTFESANLDFAIFYRDIFKEVDDRESAKIMEVVLSDEIKHVARGKNFLEMCLDNQDLWQYYSSLLPHNITPARGKGTKFYQEPRIESGLSIEFIESQKNYVDDFKITKRKSWD